MDSVAAEETCPLNKMVSNDSEGLNANCENAFNLPVWYINTIEASEWHNREQESHNSSSGWTNQQRLNWRPSPFRLITTLLSRLFMFKMQEFKNSTELNKMKKKHNNGEWPAAGGDRHVLAVKLLRMKSLTVTLTGRRVKNENFFQNERRRGGRGCGGGTKKRAKGVLVCLPLKKKRAD